MNVPQPTAAPDAVATANAQSAANVKSATNQFELGATNQIAPQGTSTYKQIGTWDDGTPRFEQTTSLNQGEQNIYDTGVQTRQNLGDIGVSQSSKIGALLDTPFSLDASRGQKIADIQKTFLDPQWNESEAAKKTELFNAGVRPGSAAYDTAMRDFSTNKQRAYDQSYLDAYNTGNQSALTERNQPINEISALLSGSQVSNPAFGNTPSPGVAPTDVIGAQQQSLNQQNVGYQANLAQNQALTNGLFGLGKTALGGWMMSDRRLKTDIKKVGKLDSGLPIYSFKYKAGGLMQLGLMAQDVERTLPDAVATVDDAGHKAVNYSAVAEAA